MAAESRAAVFRSLAGNADVLRLLCAYAGFAISEYAAWIAVLLVMYQAMGSRPPPLPEDTYLGLTATIYHLIGVYGGALLVLASAFGPGAWFGRRA